MAHIKGRREEAEGASQEVRFSLQRGTACIMLGSQENSDGINKTRQTSHLLFVPTASLATDLFC